MASLGLGAASVEAFFGVHSIFKHSEMSLKGNPKEENVTVGVCVLKKKKSVFYIYIHWYKYMSIQIHSMTISVHSLFHLTLKHTMQEFSWHAKVLERSC